MYTNCYISAIVFNWISYLLLKDAKQSVLIKKKLHRDEGGSSIPTIRGCSSILWSPVMEGPGPPNDHTWSCRGGSTIWSHLIAALGGGAGLPSPIIPKSTPNVSQSTIDVSQSTIDISQSTPDNPQSIPIIPQSRGEYTYSQTLSFPWWNFYLFPNFMKSSFRICTFARKSF